MNEESAKIKRKHDSALRLHEQLFHVIMLLYTFFFVLDYGTLAVTVLRGEISILYLYAVIFLVEVVIVFVGERWKYFFETRLAALLLTACMSAIWIVQCASGLINTPEGGLTAMALHKGLSLIFLVFGLILLTYALAQSYFLIVQRKR